MNMAKLPFAAAVAWPRFAVLSTTALERWLQETVAVAAPHFSI
jgi:hypothetical protein